MKNSKDSLRCFRQWDTVHSRIYEMIGKIFSDPHDYPVAVEYHDHMIWITLKDGRVIGAPTGWFAWLAGATPDQQSHYELHPFSIYWPDLDDGIDIEALVTGHWATPMDAVAARIRPASLCSQSSC